LIARDEPALAAPARAPEAHEPPPPAPTLAAAPAEPLAVAPVEEKPARAPTPLDVPVITTADPEAPKRSGWWSRAKASLTGKE
jgi:ribonuclease E